MKTTTTIIIIIVFFVLTHLFCRLVEAYFFLLRYIHEFIFISKHVDTIIIQMVILS